MLPLSVFTWTSRGTLLKVITMLPSPDEALIDVVAMPDPLMAPLLVFTLIVADVTPVAWTLPSPVEAYSTADVIALTRISPLSVFRVSGRRVVDGQVAVAAGEVERAGGAGDRGVAAAAARRQRGDGGRDGDRRVEPQLRLGKSQP